MTTPLADSRGVADAIDPRTDLVIALRGPAAEIAAFYAEWERVGGALVISERVQRQLTRMVGHGLLSGDVLEAIEEDDADVVCNLVTAAI